jgi:uncharacterized protein (TIGR03437 family)
VLNPAGSALKYSTYLDMDSATDVAVDRAGETYAAGWTASGASVLKVSPVPLPSGTITCVASSASRGGGFIAPGEIVDVFGRDIGPGQPTQGITADGQIGTTAGGIQVLFNGIPAPILYADRHRIRAMVPFENGPTRVQDLGFTDVQIIGTDVPSRPAVVRTAALAPGIFAKDGSSTGQALIVNEDGTFNSEQNPARQGSIVTMYATGLNQTDPPLATGQIARNPAALKFPISTGPGVPTIESGAFYLSSSSGIAVITYAGSAPGFSAGLTQINFRVPVSIFHGFTLLRIQAGNSFASQNGVYFYMQ